MIKTGLSRFKKNKMNIIIMVVAVPQRKQIKTFKILPLINKRNNSSSK